VNDVTLGNYFEPIAKRSKNPKAVANWVINNLRAKLTERNKFITEQIAYQSQFGEGEVLMANEKFSAEVASHNLQSSEWKLESLDDLKFKPEAIVELVELVDAKTVSGSAAQQVFAEMFDTGKAPAVIIQEKGLAQVSDMATIEKFCDEAIAANPNPVADYKAGKVAALNSLKGQVMKLSKGNANPALVGEILEKKLKS
jgi:aspartyl-tRNA(Asn)/glutamyl-tRNA(Gln) amidotransferase subunit B